MPALKGEISGMLPYPNIDPEIVKIGPVTVRWYGVMYVLGFFASYFLIQKQERSKQIGLVGTVAQDLIFYLARGLIIGARLGYILFYEYNDFGTYIKNPLEIIATWHGGMSFHGGLIGCVLAGWIFARRRQIPFAPLPTQHRDGPRDDDFFGAWQLHQR